MRIKSLVTNHWLLIAIVLTASLLRLYQLGGNPPGLTPDEASLGYNAYSILKTGKDEYGTFLPLIFKSFGDYKPGLYIYTTVPSVAIFSLNEFSTRLPSAIAGILSVVLVYLVSKQLFRSEKLALTSMFLAAVNPWLIHFSRGAWEVNLALTLTLVGIFFFLKSLKNQKLLILSAIFFALTFVTYQGAKLSTGIVIVILGVLYFKQVIKFKKIYIVIAGILSLAISLPIILSFSGQTGRLTVFSVFSYPRSDQYLLAFLDEANIDKSSLTYYLFYNEPLNFLRGILGRYFNHFSARFLFFEGDWANPRHTSPFVGQFLIIDALFLVLGVVSLTKNKITKPAIFIILWLLIACLPAVLSRDQVHAVRSLNMVIPMVLISSLGISFMLQNTSKLKSIVRYSIYTLLTAFYLINFSYYLDSYFVHLPKHNSQLWEYGYKQMVEKITPIQKNYPEIKIQQSYAQPYIYFLFFQKYDPTKWQQQAVLKQDTPDVGQVEKLDNICFCSIDWSVDRGNIGKIVVGDSVRIPAEQLTPVENFKIIDEINYLDGKTAWRIVEVLK